MAISTGDVSGCLEVIEFDGNYDEDIHNAFRSKAEEEWTDGLSYSEWFRDHYRLTAEEEQKRLNHEEMPESFIEKYMRRYYFRTPFLHHEKKPNTADQLIDAIKEKKLIKVRCIRCGRIFYIDEESFRCVKWQRCLKVECDKSLVEQRKVDYSHSLYQWDATNTALQVMDAQLAKVEDITTPLTYYNSLMDQVYKIKVAYISDIHLMHHCSGAYWRGKPYNYYWDESFFSGYWETGENPGEEWKKFISTVCRNLYQSSEHADILLFNGDIAQNPEAAVAFFREFIKQYIYKRFLDFTETMHDYKWFVRTYLKKENGEYIRNAVCPKEERLERIEKYIQALYRKLTDECGFDMDLFYRYRDRYCYSHSSKISVWSGYKNTKGYKKQNLSEEHEIQTEQILGLLDKCEDMAEKYRNSIDRFYEWIENGIQAVKRYEERYGMSVEDINVSAFATKWNLRDDYEVNAYYILGNHEYIAFPDIQRGVEFYKKHLEPLGIRVLQNEMDVPDNRVVIYGGTGFAKYNPYHNADTLVCSPSFTREAEIQETEKFETGYQAALEYAKKNKMVFLCASHYPVDSCLNNHYDAETVYFSGHNHRNEYVHTETQVLYADNQIGYDNYRIYFKIAKIGTQINPYYNLQDGLYETSIETYMEFYRYLGENIGNGAVLYKKCDGIKSILYMIKHKGYYGFFIVNSEGPTKGIFIVNGGKIKRITGSTDLNWICENFDTVLMKYLQMLAPLRTFQEKISRELKELGLSGKIHGTIVDIDVFHHVMINLSDGTVTCYFSPEFGLVQKLDTFEDVIKSLEDNGSRLTVDKDLYAAKKQGGNCLLAQITGEYLITDQEESEGPVESENPLQTVSISDGAYGVSRRVNPLQRLFEGKVLRDFDLRLTETKQESYRKTLFAGKKFCYEGIEYETVEDDGSDMITAREIMTSSKSKSTEVAVADTRVFSVVDLKAKISSQGMANWDTCWIE